MGNDCISRELVAVGLALKVKRRGFDAIDLQDAQRFVASIPPADVRPVVFCKDCIYDENCFAQSIFEEMSRIPFDKNRFFCADGKRHEGGANDG